MKNMFKTTILLAALTGLLVLIGSHWGTGGMIIAFLFAVILNFGSYWYSDKIVLKMYGAKEVTPAEFPEPAQDRRWTGYESATAKTQSIHC